MNPACDLLAECFSAIKPGKEKSLFLNAAPHQNLALPAMDSVQPFYQDHFAATQMEDIQNSYDLVLVLGTKHIKETQYYLATGLSVLNKNGTLLIASENKAGGGRLKKWADELGVPAEATSGHKSKCIAIHDLSNLNKDLLKNWIAAGEIQKNAAGFYSQPGLFSWDKIDLASHLLMEHIDQPLSGDIGDFGCGYGFLSVIAAQSYPDISSVTGFDADDRALACYRKNLSEVPDINAMKIATHWEDLGRLYKHTHKFDHILMNPPFHEGQRGAPSLGMSFIKNAAQNLKSGGTLWLVANTHLPYEASLAENFKKTRPITQANGFKVIKAEA